VVHGGDSIRGIDVLELAPGAANASATETEVLAPSCTPAQAAAANRVSAKLRPDPIYGWSCAVPVDL
jgi:hypothetical protein